MDSSIRDAASRSFCNCKNIFGTRENAGVQRRSAESSGETAEMQDNHRVEVGFRETCTSHGCTLRSVGMHLMQRFGGNRAGEENKVRRARVQNREKGGGGDRLTDRTKTHRNRGALIVQGRRRAARR